MFPAASIRSLACALEAVLCLFLLYTRKVWIEEEADCTSTPEIRGGWMVEVRVRGCNSQLIGLIQPTLLMKCYRGRFRLDPSPREWLGTDQAPHGSGHCLKPARAQMFG